VVCVRHINFSTIISHNCGDIRALVSATVGESASDTSILEDAFDDSDACSDSIGPGMLSGVPLPISVSERGFDTPPRSQLKSFNTVVCCPEHPDNCVSGCPSPVFTTERDAPGVVLFETGEQLEVSVNRLVCTACTAVVVYDGKKDDLVVMERKAGTLIVVDGVWLAKIGRNVFGSKDSFSDLYYQWNQNAKLVLKDADTPHMFNISKTKFIQFSWQYLTHLAATHLSRQVLSCEDCGIDPNVVVIDGVAIGLQTSIMRRLHHTVPSDQLRFPKVTHYFIVASITLVALAIYSIENDMHGKSLHSFCT
jgi:hypothetical protein